VEIPRRELSRESILPGQQPNAAQQAAGLNRARIEPKMGVLS
jgi:hypothetical protein